MEVLVDGDRYDEMQVAFIAEVAREIRRHLEPLALGEDALVQLTGDLAFSIACLVDGVRPVETAHHEVNPILLFAPEEESAIGCDGNSYMHEYIPHALAVAFPRGDT